MKKFSVVVDAVIALMYVVLVLAAIFFKDLTLFNDSLKVMGFLSLFVAPIVGIVCGFFSLIAKKYISLVFSILLIFTFPIIMSLPV